MSEPYLNYINGEWCAGETGRTFQDTNPACTSEVIGEFQQSGRGEALRAVAAAKAAFANWRAVPAADRAGILNKALALMVEREEDIAAALTAENGKTLKESHAEIAAARKEMEYQIAEGIRLVGKTIPSARDGVLCYSIRQPLGVVAVVTPWNFPLNVVSRKAVPALMAGNTVVFKPATFTPLTGFMYSKLLADAGMPDGVFNYVTGPGCALGDAIVAHPDVRAISFTGSTEVGRAIQRTGIAHGARVQLEMGGKNAAVVLEDADLDEAASAILLGAYACAGQWCTSTSRVVVAKQVAEALTERLLDGVAGIVMGRGDDPRTTMGPVAGASQLKRVLEYINVGRQEGAEVLVGGERYTAGGCEVGTFVAPTVFAGVRPHMRIAREEIFGPVLGIIEAADFDEAVQIANGVSYGLASSIFTSDLKRALTFVERSEVGLTHVNMPTAYKEPQLEFGGLKDSGADLPEGGHAGIEFFTEHKVAYIKYR